MAPLAPAPELLIGMKTMVPAPLKSGVTPPLRQMLRARVVVRLAREQFRALSDAPARSVARPEEFQTTTNRDCDAALRATAM